MLAALNKRNDQLDKLNNYLNDSSRKLSSIMSALGWSMDSISQNVKEMILCPFDQSHRISEKSAVKHLEECQWKAEGYSKNDLPLSVPSLPSGTSFSIKFDEQLQADIFSQVRHGNPLMMIGAAGRFIPRTSDRLIAGFSMAEKVAMYEYVIANTSQPNIGEDITDMNKAKTSGDGETSSYLELLAQERNLKRRRTKYRGVHTNKKSQVEILREVINQQMEMLAEYILERNDDSSHENEISRVADKSEATHRHAHLRKKDVCSSDENPFANVNGKLCVDGSLRRLEESRTHRGSSNDRGMNGSTHEFRSFYEKTDLPKYRRRDSNEYGRKRPSRKDFGDRTGYRSSQNNQRDGSKVRHEKCQKQHKSSDREKSHCTRDSKHDDTAPKKRRRSR